MAAKKITIRDLCVCVCECGIIIIASTFDVWNNYYRIDVF